MTKDYESLSSLFGIEIIIVSCWKNLKVKKKKKLNVDNCFLPLFGGTHLGPTEGHD